MKSLRAVVALVLAVSISLPVAERAAEGKAGTRCSKIGTVRKFGGVVHTCVVKGTIKRNGKTSQRLVWQRVGSTPIAVAPATTTTTLSPTTTTTLSPSATIELGHWRIHKQGSAAARRQGCETAAATSVLADGTKVVCVDKHGDKRWALAPDAISIASHNRLVSWLRQTLPTLPAYDRSIPMRIEPNYRSVDSAVIQQIVDGTKGFYSSYEPNFAFVLSTTAEFFYDASRSVLGSRYDNASEDRRAEWEFKWRKSKMESMIGGGHAGISSDLELIALKTTHYSVVNADPTKRVVEDFVREYLAEIPRLTIRNHVDSGKARQCWVLESSAWLLTFAVMEHFNVPGFNFSEQWAFWVSELAGYEGTYQFGLAASEASESVANGNPRFDMPCQLSPGVGHIQGMLAREVLHSKADINKYEAFIASDQSRSSFESSMGFSYDSWVSDSDSRTRALLSNYNKGMTFVPIASLSLTPSNAKEAEALEDVAIVLRDLTATAPSYAFNSAHEFWLAWETARDRSQAGTRRVFELTRDPLGLSASLVYGSNSRACVLIVFDPLTKRVTTYPAGQHAGSENPFAGIPPNRRCN